jgi:hypothetical protein
MKNSKIAVLLSNLDKNEFKEFGKFVKSPYFNSNANIIKLYDLISKYFPDFENAKLTKENIYSHVYPGEKYNDSTVRGLLAAMLKLGEEFLAHEHLRNDKLKYNEFLLTQLTSRKLYDLFYINLKSIRKEIKSYPDKDGDYYFLRYRMETLVNQIDSKSYTPLTQKDIPGDINVNDTDNLIVFFILTLLRRYSYLLTKTGSLNVTTPYLKLFDEILDFISKGNFKEIPLVDFLYTRSMLYKSGMDEKYYYDLKKVLFNNFDDFSHEDSYNMLGNLQNYCVQKNRNTGKNMSPEQYELYKFGIEKDILTFDNKEYLSTILFSNITSNMVNLDKLDEAKEFVNKYTERLAPERRDSGWNFNMAKIYFAEKKFSDSLEVLSKAQHEDVYYKIFIKALYAKNYYELNYTEELILLLDTFKSFLNSNIIIGSSLKENYLNMVIFLSRILKFKFLKDKDELEYLKHEILKTPNIFSKEWLIEKIDELIA